MKREQSLFESLKLYNEKGLYPMHMPGHKRRMSLSGLSASFDFTEVEGTDDLHHAEGILKDSMELTARVFGAGKSYYLVNGSTSGNLVGISALCPLNGELIVARNCHRSVFHALELRNITARFVYPSFDEEYGIFGSVSPEAVEALILKYPKSRGVVITSPTYEGVVSDISGIAEVCHRNGIGLFVDEAHGAHFGLVKSAGFPESAIRCGADLSVQSAHKTLVGLTQTAFLHFNSEILRKEEIERYIDIFETSSPSYPLMLSLDACTELVMKQGDEIFGKWSETLGLIDEKLKSLKHFKVLCHGKDIERNHKFYDFDKSKLLINCRHTHFTGESFMKTMRERYGFELEMELSYNALAMTGPGDERSELLRFSEALLTLDREETERLKEESCSCESVSSYLSKEVLPGSEPCEAKDKGAESPVTSVGRCFGKDSKAGEYGEILLVRPEQIMTIQEASEGEKEEMALTDAVGRISAEYVYCYPPGIPIVVPGEALDESCTEGLIKLMDEGYRLHFTLSSENEKSIMCVQRISE